jgi:hypothetical protein
MAERQTGSAYIAVLAMYAAFPHLSSFTLHPSSRCLRLLPFRGPQGRQILAHGMSRGTPAQPNKIQALYLGERVPEVRR